MTTWANGTAIELGRNGYWEKEGGEEQEGEGRMIEGARLESGMGRVRMIPALPRSTTLRPQRLLILPGEGKSPLSQAGTCRGGAECEKAKGPVSKRAPYQASAVTFDTPSDVCLASQLLLPPPQERSGQGASLLRHQNAS